MKAKRKIINAAVALVLLFTMAAIVAPASAAEGEGDVGAQVTYDIRYVAMDPLVPGGLFGSNGNAGTTEMEPWRTITYAVSQLPYDNPAVPDKILVGPSAPDRYGGAVPENIVVHLPVVIEAYDPLGAEVTKLNVSDQGPEPGTIPGCAIQIISSHVTLDGLYITGADVGVCAMGPIEDVTVQNCFIKVDEVTGTDGIGIEMISVKWPVIDNNDIKVGVEGAELALSVSKAWGILMVDCFTALIINNDIDVHGDCRATGIEMFMCPKSLVGVLADGTPAPNDIDVLASGDVTGYGIKVKESPLIDVNYNLVTVNVDDAAWFAMAYGIKVAKSDRADIVGNMVDVTATMGGGECGFLMARGIRLKLSDESNVVGNTVTVTSTANVNSTAAAQVADLEEDEAEDLAEMEAMLLDTMGIDQCMTLGMGSNVGIGVKCSWDATVTGNTVVSWLSVDTVADVGAVAAAGGGGCNVGISGLGSPGIMVAGNGVDVDTLVRTQVIAVEGLDLQMAMGGGISAATGIYLNGSPGAVQANNVTADADCEAMIVSEGTFMFTSANPDSVLARFDAVLLGGIYQTVYEAMQSEEVDVEMSGSMPGMQSMGLGGAIAVGIGILVTDCPNVMIAGNQPVSGTGDVIATIASMDMFDDAEAMGGGVGIGIGIAVIDTLSAQVVNNNGVYGGGTADVLVGAHHGGLPIAQNAAAIGGGAGIGAGILLVGMSGFNAEAEGLPEGECWLPRPVVIENQVSAFGQAAPVIVTAEDLEPCQESCAMGASLGVALGIASMWYPWILIEGNSVTATADAWTDVDAEAIHPYDPTAIGGAAALGIGITTVATFCPQIHQNTTTGAATAKSEVGATEFVIFTMDSLGMGGSLAAGMGILVALSPHGTVSGNHATGLGDAECTVIAVSYIPLNDAYALSLGAGLGMGIVVSFSPGTDVVRCNTAAGEGSCRVMALYMADFGAAGAVGFSADFDMLMLLGFGLVNYNSMVDATPLGVDAGPVMAMDAGLLKIGGPLDARFNWWNHPTGPSGMGPGLGEPVIGLGPPIFFSPWLYVVHEEVLDEQIGKFGFFIPMCKGLNTLSTPIALEETVVPSRQWQDIVANSGLGGKIKYVDRWDPVTQTWQAVAPTDYLDPLDAFYIYFFEGGLNVILMVNSSAGHPYAMPTRDLEARWNLIGPNPLFTNPGMPVKPALSSIVQTPAALPGYTQAISPVVHCQPSWAYTPEMPGPGPMMLSGRGYWTWMENPDTLVGFGFTPLPDSWFPGP